MFENLVEQVRAMQAAAKAAEEKEAVDRMKVWDEEAIKRTNTATPGGQAQPSIDDQIAAAKEKIKNQPAPKTIGRGLITSNMNQPAPNTATNNSTSVYNPYYDSGTGMATTNPYLQGRQR